MQCAEVIRELAVPIDDRDVAALAKHLRACASCASWAKRTAQLDRLWEATRPTEPSHDTWARMWANLAALLDSSTPAEVQALPLSTASSSGSVARVESRLVPNHASSRPRPWTFAAIALLGLGQAAAVFLAVSLTWPLSSPSVEIEEGQQVVIRFEGTAAKVVDLTPEGVSRSVDDWYVMLNVAESLPNSVVAMKE